MFVYFEIIQTQKAKQYLIYILWLLLLDNKQAVLAVLQSSSDLIKDALTELDEVSTP